MCLQEGDTALHLVSRLGQRELVEILTRAGADFTIVNKVSTNLTPLVVCFLGSV